MKQVITFKCEKCGKEHKTIERAIQCENSHRLSRSFSITDEKHEYKPATTGVFPTHIKVTDYEDGKYAVYILDGIQMDWEYYKSEY